MFKHKASYINRVKEFQSFRTISSVLVVAAIGTIFLLSSHAATPYTVSPATSGTLSGGAAVQTCGGTSSNSCVAFNSGSSGSNVKPTLVGNELELGTTGTRLKMAGVAVWGVEDNITVTGSTGVDEYNDRQTIVNTIKSWGGNEIRLRVLACDYNNQTYMSNAAELTEIQNWQTVAQAAGLYVGVTWWDPSDCSGFGDSGSNWASNYTEAFPMISAVVNKLGPTNPWVFYEPFNEPNNISDNSWLTAMEATDNLFRSDGYTGILVMDTNDYSHEYNSTLMGDLQTNDAQASGMNGKAQIIFAKHDYANEFGDAGSYSGTYNCFDPSEWPTNDFGTNTWSFSQYPVWETEFGNYNGSGTENLCWSEGAASYMANEVNNGTLVGASAFVWNWVDANSITTNDVTATQWGGYVENNFLGVVN